ncbi:tetratricopeptide (TPR) repeat protein [Streptomyces olivoverticillatus]|uniref:Tetratricopeptide (TPR) repeat protein n=1 Tax=Streptomyces olivoverticillatus TaxID=66427 RepID=A0A7W7PP23_9ACTN|nr:tetratricopeptide (TPR) repeat protein [Streptomyces olivoverticillatus]
MATTVRRAVLSLPAAPLGPENPLPPLAAPGEAHRVDRARLGPLPDGMARGIGYAPLRSLLPVRRRDDYTRTRVPTDFDAVVIENDRLRATVLPGLGGRVHSLEHKPSGRSLVYRNPVFQPAGFALNGAWFSGGIEWNIGATGHGTLSVAPLHAARVPAPDGGEMLRLWEWERLRDTPFQVDLWLPDGSDFLYAGVRIRNPHHRTVPVYWWSNTAVPETPHTRVLAPADSAWHFGYERTLRKVAVPGQDGTDGTYPLGGEPPADHFYDTADGARPWIAALDESGRGLVQTSTGLLRGRKLFAWGAGATGRRWQEWLTEPGTGGYAEIQAGLARTQLEHVPLEAGGEFAWLEAYGPLAADPRAVHGTDWAAARAEAEARLEAALPRTQVDAAYAAWRPYADQEPKEQLATGSGWGALEAERSGFTLPGTPFTAATLGAQQRPWRQLWHTGTLREDGPEPGPSLVAPHWRELLEAAEPGPHAAYHLGVAQWHAGDRSQAVRSWECALRLGLGWPALRCLAAADAADGHRARAADRYAAAVGAACTAGASRAALSALGHEAAEELLAADRAQEAAEVLAGLPAATRARGRFRLLQARILLALGEVAAARAVVAEGLEVEDLREGEQALAEQLFPA